MKSIKLILLTILSFFLINCDFQDQTNNEKPNILWIVTEDNSIHYMNLYTKGGAEMPAISQLANQGVVFNNAFSNAPVCSVARSCLLYTSPSPRDDT